MSDLSHLELNPAQLRLSCDCVVGEVGGTEQMEPCDEIIGQKRAVDAILLGLQVERPGYNDVVQAVKDGKFHIYAVSTIEEGITILTGMEAGAPGDDGRYPESSLLHFVEEKLDSYAEVFRKYCQPFNQRAE